MKDLIRSLFNLLVLANDYWICWNKNLNGDVEVSEVHSGFEHEEFAPLTDAQALWAEDFERSNGVDRDRERQGVVGIGRSTIDPEAITIFVTPVTDVSDEERYPREFEGTKVIYKQTGYPGLYDN